MGCDDSGPSWKEEMSQRISSNRGDETGLPPKKIYTCCKCGKTGEANGFWTLKDGTNECFECNEMTKATIESVDMVNHPPHYSSSRGPKVQIGELPEGESQRRAMDWLKYTVEYGRKVFIEIECIEIIRWIPDMRLATAMKYIWRVAFGGKEPGNNAKDQEDIQKAIWYLNDYLNNSLEYRK